jgi:predicted nucleotidyltransferase
MTATVFHDKDALAELCRRRKIERLALFGSTLKGTARPDSDVDLLPPRIPHPRVAGWG